MNCVNRQLRRKTALAEMRAVDHESRANGGAIGRGQIPVETGVVYSVAAT